MQRIVYNSSDTVKDICLVLTAAPGDHIHVGTEQLPWHRQRRVSRRNAQPREVGASPVVDPNLITAIKRNPISRAQRMNQSYLLFVEEKGNQFNDNYHHGLVTTWHLNLCW